MANDKTYVNIKDTPDPVKTASRSAVRISKVIKELTKEIDVEKEKLSGHTDVVKEYLVRLEADGVDLNGDNLIFLQEMTKTPSYKMVVAEIENELPKEIVEKLNATYLKMCVSNGKRVVVK